MSMIGAISLLFVCEFLGDVLRRAAGLPLPGSVLGMLVLLAWLAALRRERQTLTQVTRWLTAHLSVMFVPAAVGLVTQGAVLSRYGLGLAVATAVSVLLTLVVTVLVFHWATGVVERRAPMAAEGRATA
ncbi:CidA/LrgA family protein [Acidisoma sp. 7E03]